MQSVADVTDHEPKNTAQGDNTESPLCDNDGDDWNLEDSVNTDKIERVRVERRSQEL